MFTLPLIAVLAIYAARMVELATPRGVIRGPVSERWSLRIFWLVGSMIFIGSIAEYFIRGRGLDWPWFAAGAACALGSFALRRRAIAALGRFWSLHVEIRDEHEFVQDGPFRWMRHPTYLSMLLELLAGALILRATFTLCLVPLLYFPALAFRLKIEEAALIAKFGDAYRLYIRTTPALLPRLWPHSP